MSDQLATLKRYQSWRRGDDSEMLNPAAIIGEALDYAIAVCEEAQNLIDVKGRHHSEQAYRALQNAVKGDTK